MATALAARELRAVLDFSAQLQAVERLADLPEALLPALLRLVDADLVGWNDIDLSTGAFDGYLHPDSNSATAFAELTELPEDPPLLLHFRNHPTSAPTRISDVCDRRSWHASPAYVEVYRQYRIEQQVGFPVTTTATRIGAIAFNREHRDFSDAERDVLAVARRHIEIAHRRLVRGAAREAAIDALGSNAGWILVDASGTVVDVGSAAGTQLRHCGVELEPGQQLPELPRELTAQRVGSNSDDQLTLLAIGPTAEPAALGLTPRQYQALRAVAAGASVRIAARQLDISPQTLATHLRDAYAVLGVSGRIAALNVLREHGLLGSAGR